MCKQLTSRAFRAPAPEHAALTLIGAVRAPRVWSLAELRALPQSRAVQTMVCDAAPFPAKGWDTVEWSGVALTVLLAATNTDAEARSVQIAGLDGAQTTFSLDDLDRALLALDANGRPLSAPQGSPARLIVPGLSACAMPRFVQRLMVQTTAAPLAAKLAPRAMITRVERDGAVVRLEGLAFGEAVAVSCDGGPEATAAVTGGTVGAAGVWSLDWTGTFATAAPRFVVRSIMEQAPAEVAFDRPLARRWKAPLHRKVVAL